MPGATFNPGRQYALRRRKIKTNPVADVLFEQVADGFAAWIIARTVGYGERGVVVGRPGPRRLRSHAVDGLRFEVAVEHLLGDVAQLGSLHTRPARPHAYAGMTVLADGMAPAEP